MTTGGWSTGSSPGCTAPAATTPSSPRSGRSGAAGDRSGCPVGSSARSSDGHHQVRFDTRSLPDGVLLKACGTRRETLCPPCASLYRGDAFALVAAGLRGGKEVPETVAEHPAVLLTLTAPSFGAVHRQRPDGTCHPTGPPLSPRDGPRLRTPPRRVRRAARPGPLPRLLRLRGGGAVQRRGLRALAADHHLRPPGPRDRCSA